MAFDGKTANLLRKLRTSRTPQQEIFFFLRALPASQMRRSIFELTSHLKDTRILFGIPFPSGFSQIIDWSNLSQSTASKDLVAAAAELSFFAKEINEFTQLQARFNRHLLAANHAEAFETLEIIEKQFGVSLWLLETKLSLLEIYKGVEQQKEFSKKLLDDPSINSNCKTLVYLNSVKAEKNVTSERYLEILSKQVEFSPDTPFTSGHYFYFHLGFYSARDSIDLYTVLLFERGSSIIDRYLTFIRICQLVVSGHSSAFRSSIDQAMSLIEGKISDPKVAQLLMAVRQVFGLDSTSAASPIERTVKYIEIIDAYTKGQYVEVLQADLSQLQDEEFISLADIVVRSAVRTDAPKDNIPLLQYALFSKYYSSLLIKEFSAFAARDFLVKLAQMFSKQHWTADLIYAVSDEAGLDPSQNNKREVFAELNGSIYNPKFITRWEISSCIPQTESRRAFDLIISSKTYQLLRHFSGAAATINDLSLTEIPRTRLTKFAASRALANKQYEIAEQFFLELLRIGDSLDKQAAAASLVDVYLTQRKLANAAQLAAETLVLHPSWIDRIALRETVEKLKSLSKQERSELNRTIYVPVCYGLHGIYFGSETDEAKSIAAEEYLASVGANRPSNLRAIYEGNQDVLVFFLNSVCRIETLDSHIAFSSTDDIENERIKILQWLIEIDESKKSIYTDEIAALTQRQLLQKGVQVVDKSKIYVDVEGVKASIVKDYADLYTRFQSLPDEGGLNVSNLVLQLTQGLSVKGTRLQIYVPKNERLAALSDFYHKVRDRFVSSNEYGLDVYLSVGIRHGTLSGQLRSIFEAENLVTQRDANGQYAGNTYWSALLAADGVDPASIDQVDQILKVFSTFVDTQIAVLRNSWIQIQTEDKKTEGLFDFSIESTEIALLNKKISLDMSLNEAVDVLLEQLWRKTDDSLAKIRSALHTEFRHTFTGVINTCLTELATATGNYDMHRLRNSFVNARTRLQNEIEDIATWFTRDVQSASQPYVISYAVDVALEMVKRCYPQRSLNLSQNFKQSATYPGDTLSGMVSVLFFAFDNIMEHCGNRTIQPQAEISCTELPNSLGLSIVSDVYKTINVSEENARLRDIRSEIERATTSDKVRREGGTGLLKIAKIVRIDFHSVLNIDFEFSSASKFSLHLKIEGGRLFK